jgi:cyclophilin family peptidyl-prolyl cis-trans isomerase
MRLRILIACLLLTHAATAQRTKVVIETDSGNIVLALYDGTPQHRDNITKLVRQHFYDGLMWHRIIPGFVIQGGDPESKTAGKDKLLGDGDAGYKIPAEINDKYYHHRGAVGAARDQNPDKSSSGCQFYIVVGKLFTDEQIDAAEKRSGIKESAAKREAYKKLGGTPHLDGNYTVFGEVIEGMSVVDKIAAMPRNSSDRPNTDIRMNRVYLRKKKRFFIF